MHSISPALLHPPRAPFPARLFRWMRNRIVPAILAFPATAAITSTFLAAAPLAAAVAVERIYTDPDPSASGGITGRIGSPIRPVEQIIAIPFDQPEHAYVGEIRGDDRRSFTFKGLPMNRYDLMVIYRDNFFEGLTLNRGENTLNREDLEKIEETIARSEKFFTVKIPHRIAGTSGRGNEARAVCTFLRDRFSIAGSGMDTRRDEHRRTFKLVLLRDVGPGWQIVRARDLYPIYVDPAQGRPAHHFSTALNGIRVTSYIKDLGDISLTR